jgi:predicted permease
MATLFQDLRYALRALAKSPGFTLAAILILGLGIGANTAIFSLVDAVVLHPLPGVARPAALADLSGVTVSYPWYRSARDGARGAFTGLAAWRAREMSLASRNGLAERVTGTIVSGNYFEVLGARPAAGRFFTPADERSGEAIVVLGDGLWKTRFGSDPSIVGKVVELNGAPFTVVGLAPAGFRGTGFGMAPQVWVPIGAWPRLATGAFLSLDLDKRSWGWLSVFGRLEPGVSLPQAQAGLEVVARQEIAAFPSDNRDDFRVALVPTVRAAAGFGQSGNPTGLLGVLVGAVAAALAIACANLANLLFARAAARQKEIAVRQALGASRGRLVRQLLTESLALAALGGLTGVLVASWGLGLLARVPLPGDLSLSTFAPALDARAFGFSLLLALATGLAFGLLPALQASRYAMGAALKTHGESPRRQATRGALVVAQVSLCMVLLVAAGLLGRSLQRALATELGFEPREVTLASVQLGLQRYDTPRARDFLRSVRERVASSPGVRAASWVSLVPLSGDEWVETYSLEGEPAPQGAPPEASVNVVAPDFFRALQIPLAAGREFDDGLDREDSLPVVMINEAMARRAWPAGSALGRRILIGNAKRTVVGVSRDFRTGALGDRPAPQVYLPLSQSVERAGLELATLVVRGASPSPDVASLVRAQIRAVDPALPVFGVRTLDTELRSQMLAQRVGSAALGLFGLLSLALAAVGIYAVVSYSVARRTREIGIRMALGARAADVRALVVAQNARPLVIGLVLGLALGAGAARLLRGLLFGVSPSDPATFLAVTALLGLCGIAAAWIPARRAARIDPMAALRSE